MDYFTSVFTWLKTVNVVAQLVKSLRSHLEVPNVLKLGSLNLLEPSGPVQACTWVRYLRTIICKTSAGGDEYTAF